MNSWMDDGMHEGMHEDEKCTKACLASQASQHLAFQLTLRCQTLSHVMGPNSPLNVLFPILQAFRKSGHLMGSCSHAVVHKACNHNGMGGGLPGQ